MAEKVPNATEYAYEDLMNVGHAAAWDEDWPRAIQAYSMAIKARPDIPTAYNSLGLSLIRIRPPRLEDALQVYQKAHELDPDDPLPLEKSADVYERMGRLQDAAKQYLNVADAYLAKHDLEKAIGNWERATRVTPGLVRIHQKLAVAYERIGDKKQAVREYLTLAANFQRQDKTKIAIQAVERALRIEPQNRQAMNMLQALRAGGELIYADERLRSRDVDTKHGEDSFEPPEAIVEANPDGPIGEAIELALEQLARSIADIDLMENPGAMQIIQAIEMHRVRNDKPALAAYNQAYKAGIQSTAIHLAIGDILIRQEEYKKAVKYLDQAATDKALAAGAHHGLGIAHMHLSNVQDAARHLVRTMQYVDVGLAISDVEAGQLDAVYDGLLQNTRNSDPVALENLNKRFFDLLTGPDWKQRVEITRHQLEDAMDNPEAILDVASVSPEIVESINQIDTYISLRKFNLAMDEAFYVVEKEPEFLAAHLRVGQILVLMNQIDAAIEKYRHIAETYLARGNKARGREIFNEIIEVAPMNTNLRQDFIVLLEEDDLWEDIVDQYLNLANAYSKLSEHNNARATLKQAIQIGQREGLPKEKTIMILHRLADIELVRLDTRQALRAYENIKNLEPTDIKAREMLIDLNFRLGDSVGAVNELDALLRVYAKQRNGPAILALLDTWVEKRPDDENVRMRLVSVYEQIKRKDKALEQLNILLEKQLDNKRTQAACKTLKRILSIGPDKRERYMQLASQIGCV